jgi:hypothetical protein
MTLIVNLYGSPGSGKSTTMSGVFYHLKLLGKNAEMVTEVAKDLTWEKRTMTLTCQPYVFAKQFRDVFRLLDQVEVLVTDSPIFLSAYYMWKYPNPKIASTEFTNFVVAQARSIGGLNYFINRVKPYNTAGRNQTEIESDEMNKEIKYLLKLHDFKYKELDGNQNAVDTIVEEVTSIL